MDSLEQQEPTSFEIERHEGRQTAVRVVVDDEKVINSAIESKTRTVQQIFGLLEDRTDGEVEKPTEQVIDNPEELLSKARAELSQLEHPTIDDISRVLITSGLEIRSIKSWLLANKSEIR